MEALVNPWRNLSGNFWRIPELIFGGICGVFSGGIPGEFGDFFEGSLKGITGIRGEVL